MIEHENDPFEPVRSLARTAEVVPADAVRRRGDRRTRRARVLVGATLVLALAGTGAVALGVTGTTDALVPVVPAANPSPSPTATGLPVGAPSASPPPSASPTAPSPPPSSPPAPATSAAPLRRTPSTTSTPSRSTSSAPGTSLPAEPVLTVEMVRTSPDGARSVTWEARVRGTVPQVYDGVTGELVPSDPAILGTSLSYGDGSPAGGSDGGAITCGGDDTPVAATSLDFQDGHDYLPGTYTVTFTARACRVTATGTLTFTVDE